MTRMLPRLVLIRHGETEWSLSGRHTGTTDLPLTVEGKTMARNLWPHFRDMPFALVLSSPLQRARQTCDLAGLGERAEIAPDLSEWDYGDYEGLSTADIRLQEPGWNVFSDGCPGGESPAQVSQRADRVIAAALEKEGNIALFSHGQFGCALAARWIGLTILQGQHFALNAASVSVLGPKPGHPDIPVIEQWNLTLAAPTILQSDQAAHDGA
jgi:broad specificity phosphatase PhoE